MQHLKKIFIVDDHPVFRKGLAQLINEEKDLEVTGEAEKVGHAVSQIQACVPDLVIADITLKDKSGIDLVEYLTGHYPSLPILVISMHDESLYAERVLKAGALGYITKQAMTNNVIFAIRRVLDGKRYVSDDMMDMLIGKMVTPGNGGKTSPLRPIDALSNRELEVFQLIGRGYKRKEIADLLHLSVKTIGTHRESIKKKLNLKTAGELVTHAVTWAQDF